MFWSSIYSFRSSYLAVYLCMPFIFYYVWVPTVTVVMHLRRVRCCKMFSYWDLDVIFEATIWSCGRNGWINRKARHGWMEHGALGWSWNGFDTFLCWVSFCMAALAGGRWRHRTARGIARQQHLPGCPDLNLLPTTVEKARLLIAQLTIH